MKTTSTFRHILVSFCPFFEAATSVVGVTKGCTRQELPAMYFRTTFLSQNLQYKKETDIQVRIATSLHHRHTERRQMSLTHSLQRQQFSTVQQLSGTNRYKLQWIPRLPSFSAPQRYEMQQSSVRHWYKLHKGTNCNSPLSHTGTNCNSPLEVQSVQLLTTSSL